MPPALASPRQELRKGAARAVGGTAPLLRLEKCAILAVLFPDDFTVYDVRICEVLEDFRDAQYRSNFDELWERYAVYVTRVRESVPGAIKAKTGTSGGSPSLHSFKGTSKMCFGTGGAGSSLNLSPGVVFSSPRPVGQKAIRYFRPAHSVGFFDGTCKRI